MPYKKLRLILGDQLNDNHSWFANNDGETLYVLMEILPETGYVKHHIQKVVGFFLAMRHFAERLDNQGFSVKYFRLDDAEDDRLRVAEEGTRASDAREDAVLDGDCRVGRCTSQRSDYGGCQ